MRSGRGLVGDKLTRNVAFRVSVSRLNSCRCQQWSVTKSCRSQFVWHHLHCYCDTAHNCWRNNGRISPLRRLWCDTLCGSPERTSRPTVWQALL